MGASLLALAKSIYYQANTSRLQVRSLPIPWIYGNPPGV